MFIILKWIDLAIINAWHHKEEVTHNLILNFCFDVWVFWSFGKAYVNLWGSRIPKQQKYRNSVQVLQSEVSILQFNNWVTIALEFNKTGTHNMPPPTLPRIVHLG